MSLFDNPQGTMPSEPPSSYHSSGRPGASPAPKPEARPSTIDQIMMQRKMQGGQQAAMQNMDMIRLGGPEYFDWLDQRRMDPSVAWF